ncbi:MAG: toll/interleukin-1 receptor domain-containing protein, partial [Firmicutes bacterium]|nr:toll/interleukin-1 receptor domain-containing protein [Bacillota bacterium]
MDRYIFVSYSHQDQRIVSSIADRLERSGYSIWYDRDIQPGSLWDDTIKNRLKDSSVVLLFISSHFVRSDYCLLELKLALEQKKPIVPLYLDGAKFEEDLQRQIDRIQNIAISPTTYDECLQRLQKLDPIQKCLGKFSATPPGPDREYYSNGSVIDRITFNSIKDHPVYGDETRFLRVKLPGSDTFSPQASVKLRPGQTYEFELLIHNNA